MSATTKIEWCDATVNWWAGCTAVSPACKNCYAESMAGRLWGTQWGPGEERHKFTGAAETLRALDRKAQRLGKPLVVFHNSLSDFFDNEVSAQWRIEAMRAMLETLNLIHILLTKRIGNAEPMLETAFRAVHCGRQGWADNVPPHIWIGATIANQEEADRDIPKLLAVPAAKRFLSMEPLLGPVDIKKWLAPWTCSNCGHHGSEDESGPCVCDDCGVRTVYDKSDGSDHCPVCNKSDEDLGVGSACPVCERASNWDHDYCFKFDRDFPLDWVIVGGESGPNARPMHPDWARSLRDQCQAAGVPFMFKQWGEWAPNFPPCRAAGNAPLHWIDGDNYVMRVGKKAAGRLLDGRTWDEVPPVAAIGATS